MHGLLLFGVLALAVLLRWGFRFRLASGTWLGTLGLFIVPPGVVLSTSMAIAWMGCGKMFGQRVTMVSHGLAVAFLLWGAIQLVWNLYQTQRTLTEIQQYPITQWLGQSIRLLPIPFPYCAQVGIARPSLVVSQGLMDQLTPLQGSAVLAHEQAHIYYRDNLLFWFLGWLKTLTPWLPYTETLWQELLWLRECRADRKATESCDPLTLAETLAQVAQSTLTPSAFPVAVPFHGPGGRLLARIDYLLSPPAPSPLPPLLQRLIPFAWLAIALGPFALIPLHMAP